MNDYIAKMYTKNVCYISSVRYGVCLPVIQLFFGISIFNLTLKVHLNTSFEIRKSLKNVPSLAEINQTIYHVSAIFANVFIFLDIATHIYP